MEASEVARKRAHFGELDASHGRVRCCSRERRLGNAMFQWKGKCPGSGGTVAEGKNVEQMSNSTPSVNRPEPTSLEQKAEAARERARNWKLARRQFVSPEELIECRTEPRKAFTIRGDDWIVCLGSRDQMCGQMLETLRAKGAGAHLAGHGFKTDDEYREAWGYSRSTSLVCIARANDLRAKAAESGNLRPDVGRAKPHFLRAKSLRD